MKLSQKISNIKASQTIAITQQARDLKARGIDVVALSMGEPDFPMPEHIQHAINEAMQNGHTGYTAVDGVPELKNAIIEKYKREYDLDYNITQVSVGSGAKQCLYNIMYSLLDSGDEVIIPAPYWTSYPDVVEITEGTPVIAQCNSDTDFKLTPEILEKSISKRTKLLILNTPSNPSGMMYSADELFALSHVLKSYPDINILCDDIYEHIVYDNLEFKTLAQVAPELRDRIVMVSGVSKSYSMTGLRIGWAVGDANLIANVRKIQSQITSNPCSIAQYGAIAALNDTQDFLQYRAQELQTRRDIAMELLTKISWITPYQPQGAFYIIAKFKNSDISDVDVCSDILQRAHVALVPGSAFGIPGHFRMSFATSEIQLRKAISRLIELDIRQ